MSLLSGRAADAVAQAGAYTAAILDALGDRDPLAVLRETPAALRRAIEGVPAEVLGVPEAPGKWSIRQVLQHLADAELVGGFRFRMILAHDRPPLMGYDQDAFASALHYEDADVETALGDFATLRRANLRILERTTDAERARAGVHAERGEESVEHLMRMYAGHDTVHLRQIARIRAAHPDESDARPYD